MNQDQKILEFAEQCRKDLDRMSIAEGQYCILIKVGYPYQQLVPAYIYNSVERFKTVAPVDVKEIEPVNRIVFQLWKFD
jgi:hypothetical protein